jgi:hypothetical protein
MPQSKRCRDDTGSASLELITAGLLLLVPLVYLVLAMAAIQGGALAVEGASRQAARVFVQAGSAAEARSRAQAALDFALAGFTVTNAKSHLAVTCTPQPARCLTRRGYVTVTVTAEVPLPLIPSILSPRTPFVVPMTATSTEQVSRFWGAG